MWRSCWGRSGRSGLSRGTKVSLLFAIQLCDLSGSYKQCLSRPAQNSPSHGGSHKNCRHPKNNCRHVEKECHQGGRICASASLRRDKEMATSSTCFARLLNSDCCCSISPRVWLSFSLTSRVSLTVRGQVQNRQILSFLHPQITETRVVIHVSLGYVLRLRTFIFHALGQLKN